MASIFHQNMRRYGGGSVPRNAAYRGPVGGGGGAFAAISAGLPGPAAPIAVVGYTEITNNGASVGALADCSVSLTGGGLGGNVGLVGIGRTALAHGWEYIGIAVRGGWGLVAVGRMLIGVAGGIVLLHQRAANFALPGAGGLGFSADYRGLAYVVVTVPGIAPPNNRVAVGFLHNLYTFQAQRTLVAGQIGNMAVQMGAAIPGGPAAVPGIIARYIGGDFNVAMITPRGLAHGRQLGLTMAQTPAGAVAGGTTWSGSLYDYWYSSIDPVAAPPVGLVQPVPRVHPNTLNHGPGVVPAGTMSDHAGVSLRFV
jgi:hypothetical protein